MESIGPVRLIRAPRFDLLPLWAVGLVLVWGLGVAVATALQQQAAAGGTLCLLRSTTGLPCPTCGGTRAAMALGRGDVIEAVAFNPMLVVGGAILAAVVVGQFLFRRRPRLEMSASLRRAMWIGLVVLFLLNWAYIIARDGPWAAAG